MAANPPINRVPFGTPAQSDMDFVGGTDMVIFAVEPELFRVFPDACFGVVVAEGIDNRVPPGDTVAGLSAAISAAQARLSSVPEVREHPHVAVWRQAFTTIGWNPNRFPSSIEALLSRLAKGHTLPSVNRVVDVANTVSLRHVVPVGAHDLNSFNPLLVAPATGIEIRRSVEGDTFIPFGSAEFEEVPAGEFVYVSGHEIRTRRWVWRQSEKGKITESTTAVFFPIDGFAGTTGHAVRDAQEDLARLCSELLGARSVRRFWVDAGSPEAVLVGHPYA